ncbi:MAG TPA: hypothetical protein VHW69_06680 [Rhizomicrobium sp.]|jgi:ribonucleoside-diphosphate reductase alpha chain|nr:hypothetical protein [Rhizomicrobium sp.]
MTDRRILPMRRQSHTFDFELDRITYTATVSFFDDGALGELFLRAGKSGSAALVASHDAAVTLSIALQHHVPLSAIRHALLKLPNGSGAGPLGRALDLIEAGAYA